MYNKLFGSLFLVGLSSLYSCNNDTTSKSVATEVHNDTTKTGVKGADLATIDKAIKDTHNAKNSIDYEGHYAGILKDQKGNDSIGYHVILDGAEDYELDTKVYHGKEFHQHAEKGIFEWSKDGGSILLTGKSKMIWQVGEGKLILSDHNIQNYKHSNTNKFEILKHTAE